MKSSFRKIASHHVVAVVVFAAWLMQGIWISPVSPEGIEAYGQAFQRFAEQNKTAIEDTNRRGLTNVDMDHFGAQVKSEFVHVLAIWVTFVVLGFGAAVMAFFAAKFWRSAVIVTSFIYLWAWYNTGTTAYVGFIEAYQAKIMLAENQGTMGWFIVRDIVLPILFLSTILYVMTNYIFEKGVEKGVGVNFEKNDTRRREINKDE